MSALRSDETFVGLVALLLVPVIGWRVLRGLREGRLPIYRTYLERRDDRLKFAVLLFFHLLTLAAAAAIAADLLLDLDLKERLWRSAA